ncbi:LysR family transcriptional regulator [Legionella steigerwaltii]|uniref:LysR family transcriptional regulator n=1 Tax=Legionella steigerwaltii TaxID=460 RepID=A0A378L9P5_9GAMM|nr:LysR family transcriptional regulator [Legionella steigerwaltii]KTD80781.1 LysR family transcriptional regulator [Legionella steigerwaltii]STY23533.1 LysR family transcriptional regulator [Legionella steigerwaltii]
MIDELRALAIFAKVVEAGSFRSAANALKLSPSVVSHHVAQLEERLGAALLYRSTRRLSLTYEGEKLFTCAKAMLLAAEQGLNSIAYYATEPSGKLNLTLPAMLTKSPLVDDIAAFAKAFPKVVLSISFSDIQQDLIREGIDLAIRIGSLKDSGLKSKRLFTMKRKIVVAPALMNNYKPPGHPKDLLTWDWIGLKMRPNTKTLINQKGKTYFIDFEPRIIVDSMDAVCQFAIDGLGLATPPAFLVAEDIQQGYLVELLPEWQAEPLPIYAVWPPNASKESLTYRLITFLEMRKKAYFM